MWLPVKAEDHEVKGDGSELMRSEAVEREVFIIDWAAGLADDSLIQNEHCQDI